MAAITKALKVRNGLGLSPVEPVCVFDLVDRLEVELRLADIPSMEGIYLLGDRPTIIVSSLRPKGRQAFTCAHELGHHMFGHGEKFDELVNQRKDQQKFEPDEFTADCFASALLMPKTAVIHAFKLRGTNPMSCTSEVVYEVATFFGVGYSTLITHMQYSLRIISGSQASKFLKKSPRQIRSNLLGRQCVEDLIVASQAWSGRAIDVETSNYCVLPPNIQIECPHIELVEQYDNKSVVQAITPGIGRIEDRSSGWSAFIRVSRKGFAGRAKFRFQEEV